MAPKGVLRPALLAGALFMIGIGVYLILSGSNTGFILAGVGVVDLLTIPFTLRMIDRGSANRTGDPTTPEVSPEPIDPAADPSYNPYARED